MSEIIKFEFDRPVEVALRFTEPRVFASQFAGGDDRHMFSTVDGRVMYVNPLTSARIKALNLTESEIFWICKRKNGRLTEFVVSREPMIAAAPAPVHFGGHKKTFPALKNNLPEELYYVPPASEHEPPATLEDQLRASIALVERRKLEQAEPKPPVTATEPVWVGTLIAQTNHLVDAFAASLAHASKNHGNSVKADDIRSLLVTSFIQLAQKGGRNAA